MAQTYLSNLIDISEDKAKYDRQAKKLLSSTGILAWILRSCVPEFFAFDIPFIMEHCIEGKAEVAERAVHQDVENRQITGMNTESNSIEEHSIYFDIRFRAVVPMTKDVIALIINVEIQVDTSPGYPLIKRAVYYCSRMISEQYGTEFLNEDYGKIKKVVSIWVCPSPSKKAKDSITSLSLKADQVYGTSDIKREDFDLMQIVFISLNEDEEDSEQKIIRLLSVLLSAKDKPEEKERILEEEFGIKMTEEMKEDAETMCNLSKVVEIRAQEAERIAVNYRVAEDMLTDGEPIKKIEKYSKLSEAEIRELATKLGLTVNEG